jgi:hypothetical protein
MLPLLVYGTCTLFVALPPLVRACWYADLRLLGVWAVVDTLDQVAHLGNVKIKYHDGNLKAGTNQRGLRP